MKLSERRAEAVSAYLVQAACRRQDHPADGARHPVTQPGDCKGSNPTPALVACLQPDRRVEVEVHGTR